MAVAIKTKGCWTCKDRKVACDRGQPACCNCTKTGRVCLGYGMRLSWPRENDRRRAILAPSSEGSNDFIPAWMQRRRAFVNISSSDVELHNSFDVVDQSWKLCLLPVPNSIRYSMEVPHPFQSSPSGDTVNQYKQGIWKMLTTANVQDMLDIINRQAFSHNSPGSAAITTAVQACHLLHSNRVQAEEFQRRAMTAIWNCRSPYGDPDFMATLQRIIAVMLVVIFQTFKHPGHSYLWAQSICFAKTTYFVTLVYERLYTEDLTNILEWVFYYDVLSRVALTRYDKTARLQIISAKRVNQMMLQSSDNNNSLIFPMLGCSMEVMTAISGTIDAVMEQEEYQLPAGEVVEKFERRLKYANQELNPSIGNYERVKNVAELYRLSGLIYLQRAARGAFSSNPAVKELVDAAYNIIKRMESCGNTFPIFIIGCEARSDERRAEILRILRTTRSVLGSMNINRVHEFIERFWAQEDLDVEQTIEYTTKVTSVLAAGSWGSAELDGVYKDRSGPIAL